MIYDKHPGRYHELVSHEDVEGHLAEALAKLFPVGADTVVDVGAGTGRVTSLLLKMARRVIAVEPAQAMLDFAKARLRANEDRLEFHLGQAQELPLADSIAAGVVAGWALGHLRHWYPESWRREIEKSVREMRRVAARGAPVVIVETLGTACHAPGPPNSAQAEYYEFLESELGFRSKPIGTDYQFDCVEDAARTLGFFFGESCAQRIREKNWSRVPEWTGIWWSLA